MGFSVRLLHVLLLWCNLFAELVDIGIELVHSRIILHWTGVGVRCGV